MKILSLSGNWTVKRTETNMEIPAVVPGDVYGDLIRNKKIPDPYYRNNEKKLQWIGQSDWLYSREFDAGKNLLKSDKIVLHCDGLDTLATIKINNKLIAETDNMFRTYEWDVKEHLKPGKNKITILFKSAYEYCKKRGETHSLPCTGQEEGYDEDWKYHIPHKLNVPLGWIRKEQCNFGWDWGPMLLTCGIWKDIKLIAYDSLRLTDVAVAQDHNDKDVVLDIDINFENPCACKAELEVSLDFCSFNISTEQISTDKNSVKLQITVKNPQLWWPNGIGMQHLYDLTVKLQDKDKNIIDSSKKSIGLRTIELIRKKDKWGESFKFAVNGIEIFAKGADWIPADAVLANLPDSRYQKLLCDASLANMNMIRLWGGGIYEKDIFYSTCDKLGLLVWHDFMFACATYPSYDDDFMKNVEEEARCNIKRVRHHPCLALWCGNNELEMNSISDKWTDSTMSWNDYKKLFDELLLNLVKELNPEIPYCPSSPHSPNGDRHNHQNPDCGNAHLWDVWHGKKPFEWYYTCFHRFISEFGFQSFPEPKTINTYTVPKDRNVTSRIMEHHQRSDIGNATIMHYMLDWFKLPLGFENTVWVSQILQAMAIKHAVEHWRTNMPRTMGAIYWQLNDTWPGPSWSSIDYFCRWKALHYEAKKFFSDLLICGLKQPDNKIDIFVVNDRLKDKKLRTTITITDMYGKECYMETLKTEVPAQTSVKIKTLDALKAAKTLKINNILVWLRLERDGKIVSTNLVLLSRPKHLKFQEQIYQTAIIPKEDNSFDVKIISDVPSLWTWLELKGFDAEYEDNFFHIPSNFPYTINVKPTKPMSLQEFKSQLLIRNITNTF